MFGGISPSTRLPAPSRILALTMCPLSPTKGPADPALAEASAADYSVSVTPDGSPLTVAANSAGNQVTFNVANTGGCPDTYDFSASATGSISVVSVSPTSANAPVGYDGTVTVTFNVGGPGTGVLTLSASGNVGDNGSYNVTILSNGPVVSTNPTNGDYRNVAKCVENCFDAVASYTTPPYFSDDVPHSVQLVYRSAQAHPLGMVQVDAVDTSSVQPVKMSIQLKRSDGTSVTFTSGSTEIFYSWVSHPADGNVNRLAAQFDSGGSGLATGAHNYTAVVRSYRSDGSFRENDVPVRVLIANEASSPFGAGWSIAGFQQLHPQSGGVVITEGDGSVAYFARGATTCPGQYLCNIAYSSPKGDFSTLVRDSILTGNGSCFTEPCGWWQRSYPTGPTVRWDSTGRLAFVQGFWGIVNLPKGCEHSCQVPPGWRPLILINRITFGYNASNLLVAITDSTGMTDSLRYDASNHLRAIKDPGGRVDSITIDGSGNLTQIQDWAIKWNPSSGHPLQFQYDANHRLLHWTDRRNGAWGVAYDFAGKLAADTAPQVTANGQSVRPVSGYASVEQQVLINPASGQGTSTSPGPNVDTAVVRVTLTNPRGYPTTFALDRFGAATLVQAPLGRTMSFTRDSNSTVVLQASPSGHLTKYTWNGPDLTQVLDSTTGRKIHYVYAAGRVDSVYGDVDSLVNVWTGAILDSTHTGGAGWTKFYPGTDGRLCSFVDPGGHQGMCSYTSTSGSFANTDSISYTLGTVRYRYDGHGQRVMTIDQVHDTMRTVYDSIGRDSLMIGPFHDTTRVFYDDSLYVTRVVNAKRDTIRTWPNALGWPDSTKDPAGNKDRYQYDFNANRTSWTNRNGRTVTYTYDALDQPSSVVADGKTTRLFYDPAGRYQVDSNSESIDTLKFDFPDSSWLTLAISCRVLVIGNAPSCFRDSSVSEIRDLDTLSVLTAPGIPGSTPFLVRHHYDMHELLDTLTSGYLSTQTRQPIGFVYSAEALDSVRTLTGLNNLTITRSYPWTHRTDQVELSDPTITAALGTAYYFDSAGRMAIRYHGSSANPDTTRTLSYSRQGALVWYADSSHQSLTSCSFFPCIGYRCTSSTQAHFVDSTRYVYDSVGNRTDLSAPSGGIDPGNRLRRWQNYRMDYDAAGNMTAKRALNTIDTTKVLRTDSLFWNALGRLDSVRTRDSTTGTLIISQVGFGYDGLGRRVRKSTPNDTSRYLWDGGALLAELDTHGNAKAEYTYYPETDNLASVLRHDRMDSTYYYIQDHSRNVLGLLARTSTGVTIDNQYRYDPFGNVQGNNVSNVPNARQFAGREYDTETQLYYDRARYLDPTLGRFVSEDPIGLSGGINLYAFVGNDPVNGWDPSGTKCKDWSLRQEKFFDKLQHFVLGWGFVSIGNDNDWWKGWPIILGLGAGIAHEGPWGQKNAKGFTMGDHDLTDAVGAPCTGIFDTFFFMLVPILNALEVPPFNSFSAFPGQARTPQDLVGRGNAFPTFPGGIPQVIPTLPPTFAPNLFPPGWVFF